MICDGYTLHGRIAKDGVEQLRFDYRPLLRWERTELFDSMANYEQPHATRLCCDAISGHVLRWSRPDLIHHISLLRLYEAETELFERMFRVTCGIEAPDNVEGWSPRWEQESAENLKVGVEFHSRYPATAALSCDICQKFEVDPIDAEFTRDRATGKPILRESAIVPLCQTPTGCPKGTPENQRTLTPQNRMALRHYRENQANGCHDDDAIVRRNAKVIGNVLDRLRKDQFDRALRRVVHYA